MSPERIRLAHGSGGQPANDLVEKLFLPLIGNPVLNKLNDQGLVEIGSLRLAFTTDSYVVNPIFFPGGNIGELAVYGTVNDLCMGGARPLFLSLALIIEEGFAVAELERIIAAIGQAAAATGVQVVTGDTKVVNRGAADGIFVNTAGLGVVETAQNISADNLKPGDLIILSGSVADHGMAIIAVREGLVFAKPLESDSAPLNGLVGEMLESGAEIHAMRDPTRGGLSATLNELARRSGVGIAIDESAVPVRPEVAEACDIMGIDPLEVANEGKLVAGVAPEGAQGLLRCMRRNRLAENSCIIGEVTASHPGRVIMRIRGGREKVVQMAAGEQMPRIC